MYQTLIKYCSTFHVQLQAYAFEHYFNVNEFSTIIYGEVGWGVPDNFTHQGESLAL